LLGLPTPPSATAATEADNQRLADAVAARLRQSKILKHFQIDLTVRQGIVEMDGRVTDPVQQAEVFNVVAATPGVEKVVDRLQVGAPSLVTPAQHTLEAPKSLFGDAPILGPVPKQDGAVSGPPGPAGPIGPGGVPSPPPPEPTPIFQAGPPPMANAYNPPKMPPYAWPTYAPYNNYSRVAYPTEYPYNSWPFIGPVYPFPKIPPGWRSVTLTWRDGFWWYGRNSTGYDWWTTRYW
jgi:hypothetical protein